jgi:hypothetical protein
VKSDIVNQELAEDALHVYLSEKQIVGHRRQEFDSLSGTDREVLIRLVDALKPSAGAFLEIIRLAREIAVRDRCSLQQVLEDAGTWSAANTHGSAKQQTKLLTHALTRRRFPETARIEEKLERCRRSIAQDLGLRVEVPPDLEGDSLSLGVQFSSVDQLREIARKLDCLADHPSTSEMLLTLRGRSDE